MASCPLLQLTSCYLRADGVKDIARVELCLERQAACTTIEGSEGSGNRLAESETASSRDTCALLGRSGEALLCLLCS